jgi:hypothetical protein
VMGFASQSERRWDERSDIRVVTGNCTARGRYPCGNEYANAKPDYPG